MHIEFHAGRIYSTSFCACKAKARVFPSYRVLTVYYDRKIIIPLIQCIFQSNMSSWYQHACVEMVVLQPMDGIIFQAGMGVSHPTWRPTSTFTTL
jgi:hypothetical protein